MPLYSTGIRVPADDVDDSSDQEVDFMDIDGMNTRLTSPVDEE